MKNKIVEISKKMKPEEPPPSNEFILQFRDLLRQVERASGLDLEDVRHDLVCFGLSLAQCHAMMEVGKQDAMSLNDLAAQLGLDASTLSRTIDGMVKQELVTRRENPSDRRYLSLSLTKKGREKYEVINGTLNRYFHAVFDLIPKSKHRQILESFSLLTEGIRKSKCACGCNAEKEEK